jgi:hypothetical protein
MTRAKYNKIATYYALLKLPGDIFSYFGKYNIGKIQYGKYV